MYKPDNYSAFEVSVCSMLSFGYFQVTDTDNFQVLGKKLKHNIDNILKNEQIDQPNMERDFCTYKI